ncbi:MAG: class I SAM-dependent methyltransferase [Bradymonadia bacterium]
MSSAQKRTADASTADRYDSGQYHLDNPDWHASHAPWKADHIEMMIRHHGLHDQISTLAEIGCGSGEILVELHRRLPDHIDLTGYDISPQAHGICSPKAGPRLQFALGDALNGPLADEAPRHDLVMMIDVFEHIEDYMAALRRLHHRGRMAIFHIPLDLSVQGLLRMKAIMQAREQVGHLHYFTRETALATLADTGWQVMDERYTCGSLSLPAKHVRTRVARLPRALGSRVAPHLAARILGGFSLLVLAQSNLSDETEGQGRGGS